MGVFRQNDYSSNINSIPVINKDVDMKELIGKFIMRTKSFIYPNGVIDYSFVDEYVELLSVNNDGSFTIDFYGTRLKMSAEWNDNNWISKDNL